MLISYQASILTSGNYGHSDEIYDEVQIYCTFHSKTIMNDKDT